MNLNFKKIEVLIDKTVASHKFTKVSVSPIEFGYGLTFGNTLRRVMLNSMPGSAIIGFKIKGVNHELMSIPGTSSDTVELISQLKKMRIGMEGTKDQIIKLKVKKNGYYYARDIETKEGIEIKTPDLLLLNALGNLEFDVELYVRKFRGFIEAREHDEVPEEFVQIDGMFSPVERIGYEIQPVMVDQKVSHEQVIFDVTTDGTIGAKEAIMLASKIVRTHFELFDEMTEKMTEVEIFQQKEKERESIDNISIEELQLSVRSTNALRGANIKTVGELRKVSETELKDFRNMGTTSVVEVKEKLKELGVDLGEY